MTKKVLLSILLTIFLLCSAFGATMAFAAEEPAGDAVALSSTSLHVATYSMTDNLPSTGYPANTVMEFKDGDATIATLEVDKAATKSMGVYKITGTSKFTLAPSNKYSIKKVLFASPNTIMAPFTIDSAQGTAISLDDQDTQDLLTQAGVSYKTGTNTRGVDLKPEFVTAEQTSYTFKSGSSAIPYSTICLIYEKLPITETIYPVVSHNSKTLNAGDIQVDIKNTGYADKTDGTTINTGSQIVIKSTPGYIITSVVLRSPSTDKMLNVSYLTGAENLSVVNDELSFTITGFEAGQDYTFGNRSSTYWYVKEITITYEEHVHAPEDLTPKHDDINHWDDCICGAAVNVEAHDFVEGEITKQPGNGLPGEQLQTCQICEAEVIKYLPCPITDSAITAELASQLAYNGTEQAQKVTIKVGEVELEEGVDYTLSNNLQTNVGDHTLTITGIGKYSGERTLDFTIEKGIIARPTCDSDFSSYSPIEYNGKEQSYYIKPDSRYTISGNKQTEIGTHVAEVTLKEEAYANYRWEETTERTITYTFEITKGKVNVPKAGSNTFTYNGKEQTFYLPTNASRYTLSGDSRTQTNAGTYTVTVSLNDPEHYQWKDGTEGDLTYTFTINKIDVQKPAADTTEFFYTGSEQTYNIQANDLYEITGNQQTNAGTHTVVVSLNDKVNYQWAEDTSQDLNYTFTIAKATYDMSGVMFDGKTVTYNGQVHSLQATNLPDGVQVSYENNGQTNAGTYTVTANFTGDSANYNAIDSMTATLVIEKATYDMSGVVFADQTVTYTGSKFYLEATNLPDGVQVSYDNNGQTNAGTYTVTANFTGNVNFNAIASKEATLVIEKSTYDMSGVVFAGKTVTYNGQVHSLEATNLPVGVQVSYENNDKTNAGTYTVTANFTGDSANYNAIDSMTATLVIEKATYDMSGVEFANKTVTYTGSAFSIEATNLPNGVTVAYTGNAQTEAGEYTITATFTGDVNYNVIPDQTAKLVIEKATYDMSGVEFANKTVTYTGSAFSIEATNLPDGVSVSYENNGQANAGTYTVTANFTGDENHNAIASQTVTLTIVKANIEKPALDKTTFTFDGEEQTYQVAANERYTVSGNVETNAGNYTVNIVLKDKANCQWADGTTDDLAYSFVINKAILTKPALDETTFVYNGEDQTYQVVANKFYTVSGNVQKLAGNYTVTVTLKDKNNSQWADGSTTDLTFDFVIEKAQVTKPAADTTEFVYNAAAQTYTIATSDLYTVAGNVETLAGNYTVTVALKDKANYEWADETVTDLTFDFVIAKAQVAKPVADTTEFVYNAAAQTYTIVASDLYTVAGNVETLAGNYTVTVALKDKANYEWTDGSTTDLTFNFVIAKATYDMSSVEFANKTVTYTGSAFSIEATNLPNGVTVAYTGNAKTEAGEYTIVATFTGDVNYNAIPTQTAKLVIEKAQVTKPVADTTEFVYNSQAQTYTIAASDLYTVSGNVETLAGSYTVTVALKDKANYEWADGSTTDLTFNFVIAKATYDMSGVVFANKTVTYTGSAFSIEATNLPNGVTVAYTGNGQTEAGEYTITATFTGDVNYNAIPTQTAKLVIEKAQVTKPVADTTEFVYNAAAQTYTIAASNLYTVAGNVETLAGNYTVTVALKDKANYEWADETVTDLTFDFVIEKAQVTKPAADTTEFVYNATAQTYTIAASNLYTVSGNVETLAGNYTVTVTLKDKANYEWADVTVTDLTFNFVIAKATYDMSGVVFANKTVTYTGSAFSIEATNLPNGVTVAYTGNAQTEAGEYTITATFTGDVNYNTIPSQTAKLVIEKAQVTKPVADTTAFVYNAAAQTYTIAASNLYTVAGNVETLAGSYTVTVALKDKANYEWADGSTTDITFNFVIAKATYDMSGITFVSKTVKYDASEHEVVLTGTLPAGVTVTYTNNKGTNAGIYNAVATFACDTANYNTIADMTATLTINRDVQSYVNPETNKQDVIVSSNEGIDPTKDLVVELVEKEVSDEAYDEFLQDNQKVAVAYDIKLLQNNMSVQPDGTITIKILIPQELKNRDFEIFHIHEGKNVAVEYRIEGDYAVFETNKLSEFVFVYNMGSILWLVIVLAVIVLMEIGFLLFLSKKQKQSNTTKVLGAYPPFVFGMFIAEWQVILFIALAVAVAVLAVVIIISATKALNKQSDAPVQTVEEDVKKSTRIVKSFSERLEQSSDEVKGFYKTIKDELLSYTTVKSKISFKHETFRVGKAAVARIKMRGKSLCLFLALDPNDYKDTKYKIKDMSGITSSNGVSTMYKINLPRRVKYAKKLIADVMQKFDTKNND